jgi:hypothetical protein
VGTGSDVESGFVVFAATQAGRSAGGRVEPPGGCGGSLPVAATRAKKDCAGGLEHFYRTAWLNLDHPRNRDMHVPGDRLNDIQFGQMPKQLGMRF